MATPHYRLEMIVNGETVKKRGADVASLILSCKPELVLTECYLTLKVKKHVIERKLAKVNAFKLFNDETYREVFIDNLMLSHYD